MHIMLTWKADGGFYVHSCSYHHCVVSVILGCLGCLTFLLCLTLLRRVWRAEGSLANVRCATLMLCATQMVIMPVHYFAFHGSMLDFVMSWLAGLQYTLTSYFFISIACRLLHQPAQLVKLWQPVAAAIILGVTVITVWALTQTSANCHHPAWIVFAVVQVVLTFAFWVAGREISRRMRSVVVGGSDSADTKRRNMVFLMFVNLFASLVKLSYEVYNLSQTERECDVFFGDLDDFGNQAMYFGIRWVNLLLPIWALLWVWAHWDSLAPSASERSERLLASHANKSPIGILNPNMKRTDSSPDLEANGPAALPMSSEFDDDFLGARSDQNHFHHNHTPMGSDAASDANSNRFTPVSLDQRDFGYLAPPALGHADSDHEIFGSSHDENYDWNEAYR